MEDSSDNEQALIDRLQENGWGATRVSCYDEEGLEGWRWTHESVSAEYEELGAWDEPPPIPEALRREFG